jgi:cytochrome c oxidase assembly factor CtaG
MNLLIVVLFFVVAGLIAYNSYNFETKVWDLKKGLAWLTALLAATVAYFSDLFSSIVF